MPIDEPARPELDLLRSHTQEDLLARGMRVALGLAGPVGVILGEFVSEFVPRQKADRLRDFVEQLNDRMFGLEEEFRAKLAQSAAFSSLTEQAMMAAARTASDDRRRELAELVRTGLSQSEAELLEHEMLLRLLERLNGPQVLILYRYGGFRGTYGDPELQAFTEAHPEVFGLEPPTMTTGAETLRRWTMREAYVGELVSLGLLDDAEGMGKSSGHRRVRITPLGRLLLAAIGLRVEEG